MTIPTLTDRKRQLIDAIIEIDLHPCPACAYVTKSKARLSDHTIIVHTLTETPMWVEQWGEYAVRSLNGDHVTAETQGECWELKQEADRIWSEHQRKNVVEHAHLELA